MQKILDASALIAYLEKEPGYGKVAKALSKAAAGEQHVLMTTVNWGEVYYTLSREYDPPEVEKIIHLIDTFPIELVAPDRELAKRAALFKSEKKLPYADCFAAALAFIRKGELFTSDRDFRAVEDKIRIEWI